MSQRSPLTAKLREKFLDQLAEQGNVSAASRAINMSRTRMYQEKRKAEKDDATEAQKLFSRDWDTAIETAIDKLEAEAWRRAVKGVKEPVFYQGDKVSSIRRYSDSLLTTLLRANRNKFQPTNKTELTGPQGGPIENTLTVTFVKPE